MDRPDLPRIKPEGPVTAFNSEAGIGGIFGYWAGELLTLFSRNPATRFGAMALGSALGVLLGAFQGIERQQREKVEGRVVKDPTIWNNGMIGGWLIGDVINIIGSRAIERRGVETRLFGSTWVGTAITVACIVVGGLWRNSSMQRDMDKATAIRAQEISTTESQLSMMYKSLEPKRQHALRLSEQRQEVELKQPSV